jgi:hypothetical protein
MTSSPRQPDNRPEHQCGYDEDREDLPNRSLLRRLVGVGEFLPAVRVLPGVALALDVLRYRASGAGAKDACRGSSVLLPAGESLDLLPAADYPLASGSRLLLLDYVARLRRRTW